MKETVATAETSLETSNVKLPATAEESLVKFALEMQTVSPTEAEVLDYVEMYAQVMNKPVIDDVDVLVYIHARAAEHSNLYDVLHNLHNATDDEV